MASVLIYHIQTTRMMIFPTTFKIYTCFTQTLIIDLKMIRLCKYNNGSIHTVTLKKRFFLLIQPIEMSITVSVVKNTIEVHDNENFNISTEVRGIRDKKLLNL